jgi:hypothetical protein
MMALQEFHSHNLSEKDSCMDLLKYIHKKMKQHVCFIHLPTMWILWVWLYHTKILSQQIHFSTTTLKACHSEHIFPISKVCVFLYCKWTKQNTAIVFLCVTNSCCSWLLGSLFFSEHHCLSSRCLPFCGFVAKHTLCYSPQQLQVPQHFHAHHRNFHLMVDVSTLIFMVYQQCCQQLRM